MQGVASNLAGPSLITTWTKWPSFFNRTKGTAELLGIRIYWLIVIAGAFGCYGFLKDVRRFHDSYYYENVSLAEQLVAKYFFAQRSNISLDTIFYCFDMERKLLKAERRRLENNLIYYQNSRENSSWVTLDVIKKAGQTSVFTEFVKSIVEVKRLFIHMYETATRVLKKRKVTVYDHELNMCQLDVAVINRFISKTLKNISDFFIQWRIQEAHAAAQIVQERMWNIQNPHDCASARKLVCDLNRGCGLGCQLHYGLFCLAGSYALNRTLIIRLDGWQYSKKKWHDYFTPPSPRCQWTPLPDKIPEYQANPNQWNESVILYPYDLYAMPNFIPYRIPKDLADRVSRFHSKPRMWWIGQLLQTLWRVDPDLEGQFQKKMKHMGFKSPIVGVHVRRSDKVVGEAKSYGLEEYMKYVAGYYDKLELLQPVDERRVFLASDSPGVFAEFRTKYPEYTLLAMQAGSRFSSRQDTRYTEESLLGILADMYLLGQTDYLVCTMTSNVCRVAYGVLQTRFPDASNFFDSLDTDYILFGGISHEYNAMYPHNATDSFGLTFRVNDKIIVDTNLWNGLSEGAKENAPKIAGHFPTYKIHDLIEVF